MKRDDDQFYEQMIENRPDGVTKKSIVRIGGFGTGNPEVYLAFFTRNGKRYFAEFCQTDDGPQWQVNQISEREIKTLLSGWLTPTRKGE